MSAPYAPYASAPYVIEASQIQPFEFWHREQWTFAILFQDQLYVLKSRFPAHERLQAYGLGYELARTADTVMTVSRAGYQV